MYEGELTNKSNIILTLASDEDILGIQFDIKYNSDEIILFEKDIISIVPGASLYSHILNDGIARLIMYSMTSKKLFDVNVNTIVDIIDIQFQPVDKFRGTSIIEIQNLTLAGKAGIEVLLSKSSQYVFEVSYITPQNTSLYKNYPNPFNTSTTIEYKLSNQGKVTLIVYNLNGDLIKILIDEYQKPDYHKVVWNGNNESGEEITSGRYIMKMSAPDFSESITMTLLK